MTTRKRKIDPNATIATSLQTTVLAAGSGEISDGNSFPEHTLIGVEECGSTIVVYVDAPIAWIAQRVFLRIYAITDGVRIKVHEVLSSTVLTQSTGANGAGRAQGTFTAGGFPSDRWEVTAAASTVDLASASVSAVVFGGEALRGYAPVQASTPSRFDTVPAWTFPTVYDTSGASPLWRAWQGSSGGSAYVAGQSTPVDGVVSPGATTVPTTAYCMAYNGPSAAWNFLSALHFVPNDNATAISFVATPLSWFCSIPQLWNDQGVAGGFTKVPRCNNRGDQWMVLGLPDPTATNQSQNAVNTATTILQAANIKASTTDVLDFVLNNAGATAAYACIVDKATAPINGDTIVWAVLIPAGQSVSREFLRHMHLVNGLSFAWSSNPQTVTLAAFTGSATFRTP